MMALMRKYMMDIQPIKNENDFDRALAKIETLWGAEEGTAEGTAEGGKLDDCSS
jgi:antitoxin component HigA of HigAB toxin-antitoxin module